MRQASEEPPMKTRSACDRVGKRRAFRPTSGPLPQGRAHVAVHAMIAFVVLSFTTPGQAYEDDVHYGLTRWLALQAGIPVSEAEAIANADQQLDGGVLDAKP